MVAALRLEELRRSTAPDVSSALAKKFEHSVSLLAWAYNEEALVLDFVERAVALLDKAVVDWEIVIVNDGSTDCTGELLEGYARREPRLKVITNKTNMNVGFSARRAIQAASKKYMLWQPVDWPYDLSSLRIYLELTRFFDVVVGVRPYPLRPLAHIPVIRSVFRIKTRSDNLWRAVISLGNYYALRVLYGPAFQDVQNVHIYPLAEVQAMTLTGRSSFLAPEILFKSYAAGKRFIEVPIPFIPRSGGKAKGVRICSVINSVRDILHHWFAWGRRLRQDMKHMPEQRIYRLTEPSRLEENVIHIVAPLFKHFRPD